MLLLREIGWLHLHARAHRNAWEILLALSRYSTATAKAKSSRTVVDEQYCVKIGAGRSPGHFGTEPALAAFRPVNTLTAPHVAACILLFAAATKYFTPIHPSPIYHPFCVPISEIFDCLKKSTSCLQCAAAPVVASVGLPDLFIDSGVSRLRLPLP